MLVGPSADQTWRTGIKMMIYYFDTTRSHQSIESIIVIHVMTQSIPRRLGPEEWDTPGIHYFIGHKRNNMDPIGVTSSFELLPNYRYHRLHIYPIPQERCSGSNCGCIECRLALDPQFAFAGYGQEFITECAYIRCKNCTRIYCFQNVECEMRDVLLDMLRKGHNQKHYVIGSNVAEASTECEEMTPNANGWMRRFAF